MRLKIATRILGGELIRVGGPKMVLGDNGEVVELESDDDSASAQVLEVPEFLLKDLWHQTFNPFCGFPLHIFMEVSLYWQYS